MADLLLYSARDVHLLLAEQQAKFDAVLQHIKHWKGDECLCDEDECPYMDALYPMPSANGGDAT